MLASACMRPAFGCPKALELNQALEAINACGQLIDERSAAAAMVHAQLRTQAEELKTEIRQERNRCGAATLRHALQVSRIGYDLRLLQQVTGYMAQLEDRLSYLRSAVNTLDIYRQQIRDDLLMLRTFDDLDISDLIRQIRTVTHQYRLQTIAPLLSAKAVHHQPVIEILWSEIVPGK